MSKLDLAISYFSSQEAFAEAIQVTSQAVSGWRRREEGRQVPAKRVGTVVRAVARKGGDITHADLRPDLYAGLVSADKGEDAA